MMCEQTGHCRQSETYLCLQIHGKARKTQAEVFCLQSFAKINGIAVWRNLSLPRDPQGCDTLIPFLLLPFLSVLFPGSYFNTQLSITSAPKGCWTQISIQAAPIKKWAQDIQMETAQQKSIDSPQCWKTGIFGNVKAGPPVVEVWDKEFGNGQITSLCLRTTNCTSLFSLLVLAQNAYI